MQTPIGPWSARAEPFRSMARHINEIIHQVNTDAALLGATGLGMTRLAGGGAAIGPDGPQVGCRMVVVEITAAESGGGKYAAHIISGNSAAQAVVDLAMPESMMDTGNNNALVLNLAENALPGVHTLPVNSYHCGLCVGYTAEAAARMIVLIDAMASPMFAVSLTRSGGGDGTQTTPASWAYTVQSLDNSVTLGTNVSLSRARPNGSMIAAASGFGMAFFDASGNLRLWDAGEVPNTTGC